mmetsp:Transcript_21482/g.52457  ORF Transcript_21482/g.52457 Transcript_21482/m.52457 type:complete len:470 (-) Transcript_21482:25-1434(-)
MGGDGARTSASQLLHRRLLLVAHLVQVDERAAQALPVRDAVVRVAVLLEQRAHARRDLALPELRHGREQVVFDLVVEVAHPPVAPPRALDVDGVVRRVLDPVRVRVGGGHRAVRVREREVEEDVRAAAPRHEQELRRREEREDEHVAQRHARELVVGAAAQRVARVQVERPAEHDEERGDGREQHVLQAQPRARGARRALGARHLGVERDERQRAQVDVVLQLLRRGVVLVVLVVPVRRRHRVAEAVEEHLQLLVEERHARHRAVAALVHEPAAAAVADAEQRRAEQREAAVQHEVRRHGVHHDELDDAVHEVRARRLEVALALELRAQRREVVHHRVAPERAPVGVGGGARRHLLQVPLRLVLDAAVELLEHLRDVLADAELDDRAARVPLGELAHVVHAVADQHLHLAVLRRAVRRAIRRRRALLQRAHRVRSVGRSHRFTSVARVATPRLARHRRCPSTRPFGAWP